MAGAAARARLHVPLLLEHLGESAAARAEFARWAVGVRRMKISSRGMYKEAPKCCAESKLSANQLGASRHRSKRMAYTPFISYCRGWPSLPLATFLPWLPQLMGRLDGEEGAVLEQLLQVGH